VQWCLKSRLFRVVATLLLLAFVLWRSQPQNIVADANRFGVGTLLAAFALTIPFLYFKVLRWMYILRYGGSDSSFGEAAVSLMGGMGFALITPARVGEVARVAYLRDPRKLRLASLVMLDKFFDVLVLVLLSSVGAWQILGWPFGALLLASGAAGLFFTFFPQLFRRQLAVVALRMPLGGKTADVFGALESLSPAATALYIALTVAAFAIVILQFGIILHAAANVSLRVALLTFPLVILTNVLPLTIAGLGIREAAAVLLLAHFHVPAAVAAIAAFVMFFLNTALPGIVGALLIPLLYRRLSEGKPEPRWEAAGRAEKPP
jgi:uncharacterized membrane protein YbhN (UPF0104 family)